MASPKSKGAGVIRDSKRNPGLLSGDSAEQLSEDFHGRPTVEVENVFDEVNYLGDLAKLGTLVGLEIVDLDGEHKIPIEFDSDGSKAISLACSPDGKQLYLYGGDQSLDLDQLPSLIKDKQFVSVGLALTISYFTDKHHMSKAEKKGSEYIHEFGEEGGELPMLAYDTLNKTLMLVGGSYEVKPEGITN